MEEELCDLYEDEAFREDAWFSRRHLRADISSVYLEDNKENLSDILLGIFEEESRP